MSLQRLRDDVSGIITHLQSLPPNPSHEQLLSKVISLSNTIKSDAKSAPARIREIITSGYSIFGFDIVSGQVLNSEKFSFSNLLTGLNEISAEIRNWSPPVIPTEEELNSLSLACDKLWDLDTNRLVPGKDYELNVQDGKKPWEKGDAAALPLFSSVQSAALDRPTFKSFIALLDNYVAELGVEESLTRQEHDENTKFLNLIMDTAVMQYAHQYLLRKGLTQASDRNSFIEEMRQLWFQFYKRQVKNDSSGFEHVFLGEVKEGEVTGFHNWIRLYLEERAGRFDYKGFIKPKRRGGDEPCDFDQLISMQFEWKGADKSVSSSFIGTSPEFEMAVYTLCFYAGETESLVQMGPYEVNITCYKFPPNARKGQKVFLGTAFPSAVN